VAEDTETKRVAGYVIGKADDDAPETGHITSLAVRREYRKLGIAKKLMDQLHMAMRETLNLSRVTLNVRRSNYSAIALYQRALGYELIKVDVAYYADKEDALYMSKDLSEIIYPQNEPDIDLGQILSNLE
jgi:ribosomal protein S18 acetylase RimI-like enzyme